ncbi:hypothetical protein CA13_21730 [Planctomycetes bacterium CA13]|uniref:Uncharacterized protein n=1 Tax=Novipirellula herctigrandis TaxID=2527986 RepID=A0A5C5Z1E4_9BACT|nr:hypothetical protein CA13_21730 [Planctomycetes bacterium CA13]
MVRETVAPKRVMIALPSGIADNRRLRRLTLANPTPAPSICPVHLVMRHSRLYQWAKMRVKGFAQQEKNNDTSCVSRFDVDGGCCRKC